MPRPRVFTSFAIEDAHLRTLLVGQARNDRIDFDLVDYSVKEPWSSSWKTACRSRIRTCRAMIGIITRNTPQAEGALWELRCGLEEGLPRQAARGRTLLSAAADLPRSGGGRPCGRTASLLGRCGPHDRRQRLSRADRLRGPVAHVGNPAF